MQTELAFKAKKVAFRENILMEFQKDSSFEFILYEKENNLNLNEGFGIQLSTNSVSILNQIRFININSEKFFHPGNLDFYSINNEKICGLDLAKFNSNESKYTTLQRSTLIDFLKDEIYNQHLRFGKNIQKEVLLIDWVNNVNIIKTGNT